mgnify:CR=1 FL=1
MFSRGWGAVFMGISFSSLLSMLIIFYYMITKPEWTKNIHNCPQ